MGTAISRIFIVLCMLVSLTACNYLNDFTNWWKASTAAIMGNNNSNSTAEKARKAEKSDKSEKPKKAKNDDDPTKTKTEIKPINFAVSSGYAPWMPWLLAQEEDAYSKTSNDYKVTIKLLTDNYQETIKKYINGEVDAVAITNIDAIAQLVKRGIESDVILITSYSNGSDAILLPADASTDIRAKPISLVQYSARHYLLNRYLMRNQAGLDELTINDLPETDISSFFGTPQTYGVVTGNPYTDKLIKEQHAKILFDSQEIPKEISDLIIVKRDVLEANEGVGQAILAVWFSMMERLQGSRRGPTLDKISGLAGLSREDYDRQLSMSLLNDTPLKALSALRDRGIRKTMRYIRYFIDHYKLAGDEVFSNWVSYPGRNPATLHYNSKPLQKFMIPRIVTE
jgi:NitT/TauT family transport system substrate-binding protein